jgi:hypothetical protein
LDANIKLFYHFYKLGAMSSKSASFSYFCKKTDFSIDEGVKKAFVVFVSVLRFLYPAGLPADMAGGLGRLVRRVHDDVVSCGVFSAFGVTAHLVCN